MGKVFKVAALLVIVTVGATTVQAQWITLPAPPVQSSSGCHEHGGKMPAPATYQCCLTGHNAAVLQISYSREPFHVIHVIPSEQRYEHSTHEFSATAGDNFVVPSAGPPTSNPLRI